LTFPIAIRFIATLSISEPSHAGERAQLSAKWRRKKKDSRKFSFLRAFSKPKGREDTEAFRIKTSWTKRRTYVERKIPLKAYKPKAKGEPKPLIDILEDDGEVIVVAEFAGFDKENIRTNVKNQRLTLSAHTSDRKYYKSLNLPRRVIPATIRTAYKNGVLEIRLKKADEKKAIRNVAG
jgi:HSP20 family molecular chaperone IbpA